MLINCISSDRKFNPPFLPVFKITVATHCWVMVGRFFLVQQTDDNNCYGDFPGGPVVKTLGFHCRGHEFDPWSGN